MIFDFKERDVTHESTLLTLLLFIMSSLPREYFTQSLLLTFRPFEVYFHALDFDWWLLNKAINVKMMQAIWRAGGQSLIPLKNVKAVFVSVSMFLFNQPFMFRV